MGWGKRTAGLLVVAMLTAVGRGEIPVPRIETPLGQLPGPDALPERPEMPDPLVTESGQAVTNAEQWAARRSEMRRLLEYYAVGVAPPAPGNVVGEVLRSELVGNGRVLYRLVRLTFGPERSLSLRIGVFTPAVGGPFPAVIFPGGDPPGADPLPRLPPGPGQGRGVDALLRVGPATDDDPQPRTYQPRPLDAESIAAQNPALARGYAYVLFNHNDCGEDTTLRNADGGWAFRTTRYYPAYPGYDWGLLRGWAWGVSRIVDYLEADPAIDHGKLIVSGMSRTGKSAMVAAAMDDRLAMSAPVASSGGGTPAYRHSGAGRGGAEGLDVMVKKYPNWFSPNLRAFRGRVDRLPFEQHWFVALTAPRPFLALEGTRDTNVNHNGVAQTLRAAEPVYALLDAEDRLGANWEDRPHAMQAGDWAAMLDFADTHLRGKPATRSFKEYAPGE